MSLVLYRKYRPGSFDDVVGQDHIVRALRGGLSTDKISHAYLFTGPRGTGKTTIARILARSLNCEKPKEGMPCGKCASCQTITAGEAMDIMEIDAASNRGIDEIRALREGVRFAPSSLKYKVFIIDEVHMLTKESFNALLKTLEEPPSHAIFILATTEAHKVLPTIISRCQRYDFKKIQISDVASRLKKIADSEDIKISDDALRLVALASDGCMRDAESLLGQIISFGGNNIEVIDVQNILGIADVKIILDFTRSIFEKNRHDAFSIINEFVEGGVDIHHFIQDVIDYFRKLVFIKVYIGSTGINGEVKIGNILDEWTSEQKEKAAKQVKELPTESLVELLNIFVKSLDDLRKFPLPQMALEVAALEAIQLLEEDGPTVPSDSEERSVVEDVANIAPEPEKNEEKIEKKESPSSADSAGSGALKEKPKEKKGFLNAKSEKKETKKSPEMTAGLSDIKKRWREIIKDVQGHNGSLFALLVASVPQEISGETLTIAVRYGFNKERIDDRNNKMVIEEVIEKGTGKKLKINCIVDEKLNLAQKVEEKAKDLVSSALKIFGGKVADEGEGSEA